MKRLVLAIFCALLLCGCGTPQQEPNAEEVARLKAYQFPEPPTVQTVIDSDALKEAFGGVAQGIQIVERVINGWHKVQIIYDYPGGLPDDWESMCEGLAAGTALYKEHATVELVTPRGALLASAMGGKLTYDAFETIHEPRKGFEHEESLSVYENSPYYVSSKNAFYHADGTCGALLSRVYCEVSIDDAVDERTKFCPICAADIHEKIKDVERTFVPFEFPAHAEDSEIVWDIDYSEWLDDSVCIPKEGEKYHSTVRCSNIDPKGASWIPLEEAIARGYTRCSNCW